MVQRFSAVKERTVLAAAVGLAAALLIRHWGRLVSPFFDLVDVGPMLSSPAMLDWRLGFTSLFSPSYHVLFWSANYGPLQAALHLIHRALFGSDYFWWRAFQLSLVWASSFLVGWIASRRLGGWGWLAAFAYGLHPIQDDGLSRLFAAQDHLIAFFSLAALAARQANSRKGYAWPGAALPAFFYGCALFSKETSFVFPLMLLAFDLSEGAPPSARPARRRWLASYALCAAAFASFWWANTVLVGSLQSRPLLGFAGDHPLRDTLFNLSVYIHSLTGLQLGAGWPVVVLLAAALAAAAAAPAASRMWLAFSLAWLILAVAPVSGLLPVQTLSAYLEPKDRYLLCAAPGLCWIAAGLAKQAFDAGRRWSVLSAAAVLAAALAAAVPAVSLSSSPSSVLAPCIDRTREQGECTAALNSLYIALPSICRRDASACAQVRTQAASIVGPERAAQLDAYFDGLPGDSCRAWLWDRNEKWHRDFAAFWRGIDADRAYFDGCALLRRGSSSEASMSFERALKLDPDFFEAHRGLALADRLGGRPGAAEELQRARAAVERDLRVSFWIRTPKLHSYRVCSCVDGQAEIEAAIDASAAGVR
jgi:hypothetical protein